MNPARRFVVGVGALAPYARVGKLVTLGLCLVVAMRSLAAVIGSAGALLSERDVLVRDALLSAAVLGMCLAVIAGLVSIIVRAGEAGGRRRRSE